MLGCHLFLVIFTVVRIGIVICWQKMGGMGKFDNKFKGKWVKNGDRLTMIFDFIQKRCTISFNDELLGPLSEDLPSRLYVVANPKVPAMTLEVTKYEEWTTLWNET